MLRGLKTSSPLLVKAGNKLLKATGLTERDIKKSLAIYQSKLEELIAKHQIDIVEMPDYNDYIRFLRFVHSFPKTTGTGSCKTEWVHHLF